MIKLIKLESGSYFDEEEMLHDAEGNLLPDGLYETEDGKRFMYEGNYAQEMAEVAAEIERERE